MRRARRVTARSRRRAGRPPRVTALSAVLLVLLAGLPPAGTARPVTFSVGRLWSWLAGPGPSPRVPVQHGSTARGWPHAVPASVTRARHGTGRAPGRGAGQLPAFRLPSRPVHLARSGAGFGTGSHSFNPLTSRMVPARSSATSTLFQNADGTYTRRVYAAPVNYQGPGGGWQPINTALKAGPGGRLDETANALTVSLAPTAGDPDLVSVGFGAGQASVSYGLQGAAPARARVSGSSATYPGVLPATDLVLSAAGSGLKESLVLHGPQAPASWVFPLRLHGLTPQIAADGSVEFRDAAGALVARVPRGYLRDSSVTRPGGRPAQSAAVSYQLISSGGQPALQMTVDAGWLNSPARVFPVIVDPTFNATTTGTTYVSSLYPGDHSSEYEMPAGTYDGGTDKDNSLIAFSGLGSALSGERITSASLHVFDIWAYTCTAEPFSVSPITQSWSVSGSKTWPGPSLGASIGSVTASPGAACTNTSADATVGTWMTVPLSTGTFNSWVTGGADNGLALSASGSDNLQWKYFDSANSPNEPYLVLNYTPDVAPQIDSQYPPDNYGSPTLTPELIASGHDPDNWPGALRYAFTVYSSSGSQVATSGLISAPDWPVPAGKLSWSQSYYWTVQDYDGYDYSSQVTANTFTTQVPQPLITSSLAQNSGGHGFDPSIGNYTTSATDADVQTAGPALSVQRSYNSLDPRTTGAFGEGWSSVYDMRATEVADASGTVTSVVITYPDGSQVGFGKDSNGTFAPPPGRFATLTALAGGAGYTLTDKNDTTYTFRQAAGTGVFALSSIADYLKNTEMFSYGSNGQLATATSAVSGRALHFTWATPSGAQYPHVASVTTDDATAGVTASALTWTYSYSGDDLAGVCPPASAGACTSYSATAGSHFPDAVLDAGPHSFWRMDDTSGTVAADAVTANEGSDNGTYSGVTLGQPGPLPGSVAAAATFNGTSSYLNLPSDLVYQSSYASLGMWFKTTSSSAGMLFSTGHSAPGTASPSSGAMPVLYVGSDGHLYGHFWNSTVPGLSSPGKVNDGSWHFALLTSAGNTQTLYLDGTRLGTLAGQIDDVDPLDMIGTGVFNSDGWPAAPSGNSWGYFSGQIADAAFYTHYLTPAQAGVLYATGHTAASLLTTVTALSGNVTAQVGYDMVTSRVTSVTDEHGGTWGIGAPKVTGSSAVFRSAVLGAAPAGYWRLGETGSAAQADNEVNGGYGQYANVTLGGGGPFADETAAGFDGTDSSVSLPAGLVSSTGDGSVGLWFKTTASSAGMLFSTGHSVPGTASPSSAAMPVMYVGSDGKLHAHFWTTSGNVPGIASPGTVNDGGWHFAVLTASGGTQALYLDGKQAGTLSGTVSNDDPLDMVGAGVFNSDGWPAAPSGNTWSYFHGSVGEVAFYRAGLSAAQVAAQWAAYKSSSGVAPVETVTVTDPGGHPLSYSYDPRNGDRILSETDALGGRTSYGYDTSGFLRTVTNPDGDLTVTGHDVRGNIVSQATCQDQAANQCSTEYYTYYPDDTSASLSPDPRNDLLLTMRDGRSASATDGSYLTSYAYDAAGNRTSITTPPVAGFPGGRVTALTYTTPATPAADSGDAPPGLLATATSPGGGTETITYDHDGDPAAVTDPAGEVTRYSYDGLGRVAAKTVVPDSYPGGLTTSYTYDGQNRLLTQTDPGVTDRVTGAVHTARTTNSYDADGNLTSVTVADLTGGDSPRTTGYAYNSHDEQVSVTDPAGAVTRYGYDAYGNKASETDPAGDVTGYAYDPDGHLLTTTLEGYTGDPASPSPPLNLVLESRAYDPAGRLASITDSMGRVTAYTYTDNGLLASVTRENPASGQSFVQQADSYDGAGNLIAQVTNNGTTTTDYAVDAADRTLTATLDPSGLDRTTRYAYSPDDFVLNVTHTDATGAPTSADDSYDPLGRRTAQAVHDDTAGHPAGWWPLTGTPGPSYAPDSSGSGNTALLHGGVSLTGSGASFNGSNGAVSVPGSLVQGQSAISVSLWFKTTATTTGTLFSTGNSAPGTASPSGSAMPVLYVGSDGRLYGHFWTAAGNVPGMSSAAKVNDGAWHHVVLAGSGSSQALYLDGSQVGTLSGQLNNTDPLAMVGAGVYNSDGWPAAPSGNTWNYFAGQITDVQVYPRAVSAAEAGTLDSGGQSGPALDTKLLRTTWALDQRGLPTSVTTPDGATTSYAYDEAGKLAQVTQPAVAAETGGSAPVTVHPVTSYGYDAFGDQVSVEDPDGNITTTGYDADGRPVTQTRPAYTPPGSSSPVTATSTSSYDRVGQLVSATDPLGNTTTRSYDQLGDLATVTDPAGGVTRYTYDTDGEQLSATNPAGAQVQATYDFLGRPLTSTQIVRQPSAAAYTATDAYSDTGGYLSSVTSPAGVTTSYGYDAAGERTKMTGGAGNVTSYGYDLLGRQTSVTWPDGTSQHVAYDEAGRAVHSYADDQAGTTLRSVSTGYDDAGLVTSATDAMGATTTFAHDASGRVTGEVQPVSGTSSITTSFGYDPAGNLTRYTDGNGNATVYTYNSWNLPESTIVPATAAFPDLASRTYATSYTADGQVARRTLPGGVTITDSYDSLGRLTSQQGAGAEAATASRTFGYDPAGNLTSATTAAGTDTFSYDDRGLLLSAAGPSGSSSFGYNPDGQMTSRTDASGTTSYGYDTAGRLATLTDAATATTLAYGYNADSLLTSITYGSGGATRAFGYNSLHELTSDTLTAPGGQAEASISYGYNLNGDETSKASTGFAGSGSNSYTYDQANRLTSWNNGSTTVSYGYDANGNRIQAGTQTLSYDARDELTSGGGKTYSYTARGTLASVTSAAVTTTSTSDAFGQVATDGTRAYSYDALGRVLTSGGHALSYSGLANDVASDGTASYSRDPGGGLIGLAQGGSAVLALADQHQDVVGEFTATGTTLAGSAGYDPLGNVTASSSPVGNLGYQSGWTDPATGRVNMSSRWYDPAAGQFTSRDGAAGNPVPDPVAANAFAYGNDNPLTAYDPLGTCDWWNVACGVAAAASAVWNTVSSAASSAWNTVSSAVSAGWNAVSNAASYVYHQAAQAVTNLAAAASHVVSTVTTSVSDGWNNTWQAVTSAWTATTHAATYTWHAVAHAVYTGAGVVWQASSHVVYATAQAVKYGAQNAASFVQHHAGAIVSFVASTAVFLGCEAAVTALTAGAGAIPGAIGCGALAGAVGGAINYAMSTPMSKWTVGGFASQTLIGAAAGAAGSVLGVFGGRLLGPVLEGIGSRLGAAAADDGASALADTGTSLLDNGATDAGGVTDAGAAGTGDPAPATTGPSAAPAEPSPAEPAASSGGTSASPEDPAVSCDANSFPAGTRVLLADGTKEAIGKLRAGQKVLAGDPYRDITRARQITRVITHSGMHVMVAVTLAGGAMLAATDHHPFWDVTARAFTYADALRVGDRLLEPSGHTARITAVHAYRADLTAYNLTVSGTHTYYVFAGHTPVLVHNACTQSQVGYASNNLGRKAAQWRADNGVSLGRNVAAAQLDNGDTVYGISSGGAAGYHAEEDIINQIAGSGRQIVDLYTERQPCGPFSHDCAAQILNYMAPNSTITWSVPWSADKVLQDASNSLLIDYIKAFRVSIGLSPFP